MNCCARLPGLKPDLNAALSRLVSAELLEQRLAQTQLRYNFRHALIRDAAYESLLKSQRRRYHRKIAEVLLEHFVDVVKARPELVASHFSDAGLIDQAIPYWQKAGSGPSRDRLTRKRFVCSQRPCSYRKSCRSVQAAMLRNSNFIWAICRR